MHRTIVVAPPPNIRQIAVCRRPDVETEDEDERILALLKKRCQFIKLWRRIAGKTGRFTAVMLPTIVITIALYLVCVYHVAITCPNSDSCSIDEKLCQTWHINSLVLLSALVVEIVLWVLVKIFTVSKTM